MGDTVTILLWLGMWIKDNIIKTDDSMVKGRYYGAKKDTCLPRFLDYETGEKEETMSEIEDIAPTTSLIQRVYEDKTVKVSARIISLVVLLFKTPVNCRLNESLWEYYKEIHKEVSQAKFKLDFFPQRWMKIQREETQLMFTAQKKRNQGWMNAAATTRKIQHLIRRKKRRKKDDPKGDSSDDNSEAGSDDKRKENGKINESNDTTTSSLRDSLEEEGRMEEINQRESSGWVKINFASEEMTLGELFDMVMITCRMVGYNMEEYWHMITAEWWLERLSYFSLQKQNVEYTNVDDKTQRDDIITRNTNRRSNVHEVVTGVIVTNNLWEEMGSREGKKLLWILKKGTNVFGWKRQGQWGFEETKTNIGRWN